ncbi:DUF86 domain-containing protein [Microcoleus sp.]|uniref:HepT-like ribonuclease domain-containing protein n=1 Tax=Microcoleus sp. TaxID=44472 RepID=UPI003526B719
MNLERDRVYIEHILECINKINEYTGNDRERFMRDDLVQDGVLRRLQTMAESTQRLSDDLKTSIVDIDWRALSGFRNILVHDYLDGIDLNRIWDIIENYLPDLERATQGIANIFWNN